MVATTFAPNERVVLLLAWAEIDTETREVESGGDYYPVVGITLVEENKEREYLPVIVYNGHIVEDCGNLVPFADTHTTEVVYCDWPKHLDEDMLGKRLERMQNCVAEELRQRLDETRYDKHQRYVDCDDPPDDQPETD